ncbi:MFS transporter [Allopontixanthobacter sediminis]|uniref:MFS transporter n=1 Tax=Allopontixanthobacter sediminis TaxID=1689985 RepID=A0A845B2E9_9SPHN|nr:MFS transporter [Allopontixanthobacter sediminis]
MLSSFISTRSMLLAIFMLMAGNGVVATLVSFRLESAGTRAGIIGLVATCYFVGLTIGALRALPIIQRVGHIRTFAAAVSLLSASTLAYTVVEGAGFWAVLRFTDGLCVAAVFVCLESWLNERAEPSTRGSILASYMISLYAGQAVGQFLLNLDSSAAAAFVASSLLVSLSVLPIALTRLEEPAVARQAPLSIRSLYAASPLGVVGCGMTGLMLGAFYGLGAVYARRMGLEMSDIALFMSVVIAGGVALQWPVGWLSDRFDRRMVIVATLLGATAVCAGLAWLTGAGPLLLILGAIFGGLSFALYPLCVAHTNDHLSADQRVSASGGLVLTYSIGAAAGPTAGAGVMMAAGEGGLFLYIGTCALLTLVFALWRQLRREPVPSELQQPYQMLPRTTPAAAELGPLPRSDS